MKQSRISVLVAGAVVASVFAPTSPASAQPARTAPTAQATTESTAAATAKKSGKRVELTDKRTESGQVFVNPDGHLTAEFAPTAVRVKHGDTWVPVDTALAKRADGTVAPKAASADLSFSGGGTGVLARIKRDGKEFALTWPSALPSPTLAGDSATYPNVLPDTDLVLRATSTGFSHLLVVKTPTAAKNPALAKVRFGLSATGLTTKVDQFGAVTATDTAGKTVFTSAPPTMWDAPDHQTAVTPAPQAKQAKVGVAVTEDSLVVTPDQAMLADPAARFPLMIDPTFLDRPMWDWNLFEDNHTTTNYWGTQGGNIKVGPDGVQEWRGVFRFWVDPIFGASVRSAQVKVVVNSATDCGGTTAMNLHYTTKTPQYATWDNSGWGAWMASALGCGDANGLYFPSTSALVGKVQEAATGRWSGGITFGVNTATSGVYKQLTPGETRLVVEYNHAPNAPANLGMVPVKPCGTGADRVYITTATPKFGATLSDPNTGDTLGAKLEIVRKSDGAVVYSDPPAGQTPAPNVVNGGTVSWPPVAALAQNVPYTYRATTWDGLAWSGTSAPGCEFVVDLGAAGTPDVTSSCAPPTCDPADGLPVGVVTGVTVSPAAGDTTIVKYLYGIGTDSAKFTMSVAAGPDGTATIPVTPWEMTRRFLFVKAVTRSGIASTGTASIGIDANLPGTVAKRRGDANGDGLGDVASMFSENSTQNSVYTWNSAPTGGYQPTGIEVNNGSPTSSVQTVRGDVDGDGLTDIILLRQEAGDRITVSVYKSDGTSYQPPSTPALDSAAVGAIGWYLSNIKPVAADFDGDGLTDLGMYYGYGSCQTKLWVFYSTGTGFTSSTFTQNPAWASSVNAFCWDRFKPVVGDFDNAPDHKQEVAIFYRWDGNCDWSIDTFRQVNGRGAITQGFSGVKDSGCSDWNKIKPVAGDFNGDQRDDIGEFYDNGSQTAFFTLTSTGNVGGNAFGVEVSRWSDALAWNQLEVSAANVDNTGPDEVSLVQRPSATQTNLWTLRTTDGTSWSRTLRWDGRVTAGLGISGKAASLTGDARADTVRVMSDGGLNGAPNLDGIHGMWGAERYSAGTSTDPARAFFADLDGDGRKEFVLCKTDGALRGYKNIDGLNDGYGVGRKVGEGFLDPARLRFADLNGDGLDDLVRIEADGTIQAWSNVEGLNNIWGPQKQIATGFPDPARVRFADLNGDGRDDLVRIEANGDLRAWVNVDALSAGWAVDKVVGGGFTEPSRLFFADLDGDRRDDAIKVETNGDLRAWPNPDVTVTSWGQARVVSSGWTDPARLKFA